MITAIVPRQNDEDKEINDFMKNLFSEAEPKENTLGQYSFDRWLESELNKAKSKRPEQKKDDPVNHPAHYTEGGIETIDFIEAKHLGFCLGNVVKYVVRAGKKDDQLQDLKKARWYLDREIASLEKTL